MSKSELDKVKDGDSLISYLYKFVDCYDEKLTMFLKVRAMILALNDAMPIDSDVSLQENSIDVTEFMKNFEEKYKELKQKYMVTH